MKEESYYQKVYDLTRLIPRGKISTYGALASYLALGSARMVGWALNKSFMDENVPAHRVVNRKGELSGRNHFSTPTLMQELLESEGAIVEDSRIRNFKELFWDPAEELDIEL